MIKIIKASPKVEQINVDTCKSEKKIINIWISNISSMMFFISNTILAHLTNNNLSTSLSLKVTNLRSIVLVSNSVFFFYISYIIIQSYYIHNNKIHSRKRYLNTFNCQRQLQIDWVKLLPRPSLTFLLNKCQ